MKSFIKAVALAVMLILGGQAFAQTHGAMFLGASIPMDDFGEFDGFDDFALTTVNEEDAGAAVGFNAGIKWYFDMGIGGLGVMLSVDGFYNGPNSDLKAAYRDMESQSGGQLLGESFTYNATPRYINVPAMLGLNYTLRLNPQLAIYAEAGLGGNLRFITDMESLYKGQLLGVETSIKDTQSYDKAFSFAYQAGFGIEVAKNLVIGCSIYDLGEAEVKGEQVVKTTTLNDNVSNTATNYNTFGTIHPIMVVGRIGFAF